MKWLISIPVWGVPYRRTFIGCALPAIASAVAVLKASDANADVSLLIHTDSPSEITQIAEAMGLSIEIRAIPNKSTYVALQEAHQDAVRCAEVGTRVVLLNADLVISANLLVSCSRHFKSGKQAIVLLGIRTDPNGDVVPIGWDSRRLLEWAWEHRHQIIKDLEWNKGGSLLPTNLFFSARDSVIARGFHLHPVSVVKSIDLDFHSTIDGDLLDKFPYDTVHVVTDPDDMSMLEISEPSRRFPVRNSIMRPNTVAASMRSRASAMHRWLFTHRILVKGDLDDVVEDIGVGEQILNVLGENTAFGRQPAGRGRIPARG